MERDRHELTVLMVDTGHRPVHRVCRPHRAGPDGEGVRPVADGKLFRDLRPAWIDTPDRVLGEARDRVVLPGPRHDGECDDGGGGDDQGECSHDRPARAPPRRGDPLRGRHVCRRRWQRRPRRLGQLSAGLPAIVRVLGQRAADHRVEPRRQAGPPVADTRRLVLEVRVDLGDLRGSGERHLAGEALEQHAAERVHVRPSVHCVAADPLRREVGPRPNHARLGQPLGRLQVLRDPEVDQVDALLQAVAADQGIARLDVPMHESVLVRRVERSSELGDDVDGAVGVQSALGAQEPPEVRALDVAHGDVEQAIDLARVVDRDDARMLGRRRQSRLTQEARTEPSVVAYIAGEQLERDVALKPEVLCPVHHSHAAVTEQFGEAVLAERRPHSRDPFHGLAIRVG